MRASLRTIIVLATAAADFPLLPIAPPLTTLTNLKTDPTDVFVCSWPKSGTTWMQAIVAHLVEPDRSRWAHVSEVTPFYDVEASWDGDRPSQALTKHFAKRGRRCWNTHLLWSLIPKGGRYVYVVRDPADAVVSFWHHLSNQRGDAGTYEGTLPEFAAEISQGTQPYGAWSAHVSDWAASARDPAVLIVRYADMKRDAAEVIRRVAAHLGVEHVDAAAVARLTSFDEMKADAKRYAPVSVAWAPGFEFIRAGRVGDGAVLGEDARRALVEGLTESGRAVAFGDGGFGEL